MQRQGWKKVDKARDRKERRLAACNYWEETRVEKKSNKQGRIQRRKRVL